MRTIYIKTKSKNNGFYNPWYWKVTESHKVFVTKDSIEVEEHEDFFEEVSFIKNTQCKDGIGFDGSEEITREEFDSFYMNTVNKINNLSAA